MEWGVPDQMGSEYKCRLRIPVTNVLRTLFLKEWDSQIWGCMKRKFHNYK